MPSITQIAFSDLVTQIKREARLSGSTDLDDYIKTLINELLLDYCSNNQYFELLQLNIPLITAAATTSYPLPIDYLQGSRVQYKPASGITRTLYLRNSFLGQPLGSVPRFYQIAGNQISIYPFDDVVNNETILLDYYKAPDTLSADGDLFPIPKLIAPLKQRAIYRALLFNNSLQQASAFKGDASENEIRSKPSR